ncbi:MULTISPECIES: CAP domain-containing protein [unclassified Acinetobacter]|uniref:CAP domain-containing protein n=1 Tax=unclassified Acinetobacter TaxID=196816 RepID=UPI00293434CB|nr:MULTISPECIES: CAP domain-containing protein [unclassified Acinetobacter]WOE32291.1 CAP domain-containing protein [Acinetobacter sp. SAAs470]WOE37762.1 CAP domain-containing protein [Acinetobacter sp. SAAs474]
MNINKILVILIVNFYIINIAQADIKKAKTITCDLVKNPNYREEILKQINSIRSRPQVCGNMQLSAANHLKWSNTLYKSAQVQAKDNAEQKRINHLDRIGNNLRARMQQAGYTGSAGGENLASGQGSMDEALMDWLKLSPSHCSTLMDERYTEYAISCVTNSQTKRNYWVQHFGRNMQS